MKEKMLMGHSIVGKAALHRIGGYTVRPGVYMANGAYPLENGVNFTISTHMGTSCELLLFKRREEEPFAILPFPETYRIGDTYSMFVYDLNIEDFEYAYRIDGPHDMKKGLLFDKTKLLLDPYAQAVTGQQVWGTQQTGAYRARVVEDTFDWDDANLSKRELSDLVIYELHVRGFTMDPSSGVKHRGTFRGLMEKIPYLKELGINAVELMPIFEFDETSNRREYEGHELLECWGYNTVSFFAPNTSYTSRPEHNCEGYELKELIKAFHDNDIDVILDVVFNHTAEGNFDGRMFSFKGIDNQIYYMLTPEGEYYNFSGCGNTLNCNHPIVRQMILECLRYWTITYRVDGFRFDLASILGRGKGGEPLKNPPLLEMIANDPILSKSKLIAEAWDAGGLYQVGKFPAHKRWAEWNGRYRDCIRGFLKGDFWESWKAAWSIAGSGDLYGVMPKDSETDYDAYNSCVNFITCHDGFTLADLYAYNEKHNECNGWNNTDGANDNRSWNCGVEGPTDDPEIMKLRKRMIRNACAVLMCSRGTPMFLAGDEFGNTQNGNNNCYCQDNEMFWLDWTKLEKNQELFKFFQYMIAFRNKHEIIRKRLPEAQCGLAPVHAHDVNADNVNLPENARTIGMSFAGYDEKMGRDDMTYMCINAYWADVSITLPRLPEDMCWYLYVNTYGDYEEKYCYSEEEAVRIDGGFNMKPRSVAVFAAKPR